ncbi:sigma-70 family RNA polymerase sigma factor [Virgibacillus sp. MSP4-1]|uniref:sigma-70 family RNA polymerase sigma factor n=1 Tax=Virgibacillus sp. MSP4-1 TaxID=2700081 RepID=UPI0005C5C27C|nr:sigma-70 family RNA polymerase sigma factor [Virgibacillus sp. MSP4-1]QHS21482.1 sigma-70 family RNA polymerase sigma factor [Virgibacillus sp. MSP4-1]
MSLHKDFHDHDREITSENKEDVMELIFNHYGENIKALIYTYVKNDAQTDDIFQEFLISVYKNLDGFQHNSKLKTWLYRIAINKSKDYLRSPIHRFFTSYDDQMAPEKIFDTPEEQLIKREVETNVVKAILSLPVKYREIFVLRFYHSYQLKEISEFLDINESTVKTRFMRGKKKLKSKLGGDFLES